MGPALASRQLAGVGSHYRNIAKLPDMSKKYVTRRLSRVVTSASVLSTLLRLKSARHAPKSRPVGGNRCSSGIQVRSRKLCAVFRGNPFQNFLRANFWCYPPIRGNAERGGRRSRFWVHCSRDAKQFSFHSVPILLSHSLNKGRSTSSNSGQLEIECGDSQA